ncbi:hypothetical protein [Oceanobacillus sojae]|uniref:PepSY domain-containing protein n=1 Tax=Oceanobacillus sojae TaxID=582851 RepID=A0A511ZEQ8_9BACI|nr:hypothetical protein [Oceanobacillus sojae]GEN85937.1 hypothetical protein OSO01_06760 [Oceanobacillus sojae]
MNKAILIVFLLLISLYTFEKIPAHSRESAENKSAAIEYQDLTIKQAIKLAYPSALKWDKNALLLRAVDIDLDEKSNEVIGRNGKRKHWNIAFGVPDTNKFFLVTIHNGKIDAINDLTNQGDTPYFKKEFTQIDDIHYDSPELLKKALKTGRLYPGKDWAKGYNFILLKDIEKNISFISVVGWNRGQTQMREVSFNVETGEYISLQD